MTSRRVSLAFGLVVVLAVTIGGCGGGSAAAPTTPNPITAEAISVVVTPSSSTLLPGQTQLFVASVTGTTNSAVTWSVQETSGGTINSAGLYTAPQNTAGTFNVVATSQASSNAQGIAAVTVQLSQVAISPAQIALSPGATQTFTATVAGLANTQVTWSVQEADGGLINGAGLYTAPKALGFYHVIATSVGNTTASASGVVSVTNASVSFFPTGSLHQARGLHTATLLNDGTVLVAGGANKASDPQCIGGIVSTELYDAYGAASTLSGSLNAPRYSHTATLLTNGNVLVVGGFGNTSDCQGVGAPSQNTAELYDAVKKTFSTTGSMSFPRGGHTATPFANGMVLITGGANQGVAGTGSATAELYDPDTGAFTQTGSMTVARFRHTATLLPDGTVLIVGGVSADSSAPTSTAELYDPATGAFTATGSMATAREQHTATLLTNGKVLITGGQTPVNGSSSLQLTATAEIYDPSSGTFASTGSMTEARNLHTATLLTDGTVLFAGGGNNSSTAEVYSAATGSFTATGSMEFGRAGHTATAQSQPSGVYAVLVVGGGSSDPIATAEIYAYANVWDY
jgi:Bacterial Ig-like domain (group 2)/Galactose oxidase, central domain